MQHQIIITSSGKFSSLQAERKNNLIALALRSSSGRSALAQAMANPIRRNLDYQGIARRAFVIDPLSTSALSVYNKNNSTLENKVTIPDFEIATHPSITLKDITTRRFSIIDRAGGLHRYRRRIYIK